MSKIIFSPTDDDIKSAEEKFAESLAHAQIGMFHLLENDVRIFVEFLQFMIFHADVIRLINRSNKSRNWLISLKLCWIIINNVQMFSECSSRICR